MARDPLRYERIRRAGMAFVQRFTRQRWTYILDWLDCRLALRDGQRIRQAEIYGAFTVEDEASADAPRATSPRVDSAMTAALRHAQHAILTGDGLRQAEASLLETSDWLDHVAEPYLLLGLMALLRGHPAEAALAIECRARSLASQDPALANFDPVELAWLLLIARLRGETATEQALMQHTAGLEHVSLRRMLWLLAGGGQSGAADLLDRRPTDRLSVHWMGEEDFPLWCDLIRRVVASNGATQRPAAQLARALAA